METQIYKKNPGKWLLGSCPLFRAAPGKEGQEMNERVTMVSPALQHKQPSPGADHALTICAISILAGILTNILH